MKTKKFLSALIAGAMVAGTVSIPVFAEGEVAAIGGTQYSTMADAVANAQTGETIDLKGNTIVFKDETAATNGQMEISKNIKIENGTIDITDNQVIHSNAILWIHNSDVTFENVKFVGENFDSAFGVIYLQSGTVTINGCEFNLKNDMSTKGGVLKGDDPATDKFIVSNTTMNLENPTRVLTGINVDMDNVTIDAKVTDNTRVAGDLNNHAIRSVYGTITNSSIKAAGFETGIKNTENNNALNIETGTNISLTDSVVTDVIVTSGAQMTIDDTSRVYAQTTNVANNAVTGNLTATANVIAVKFVPTADERIYEIVLEGANNEKINRLNTVDLTFTLTPSNAADSTVVYDITAIDGMTLLNPSENRYEFHYDGKASLTTGSGNEVKIGEVEFIGYTKNDATITFAIDDTAATNLVTATTSDDNIVTYFKNDGSLIADTNNTITDKQFPVPTHELTINVTFPNAVTDRAKDYQAMSVTISGGDLAAPIVNELGSDSVAMINGAYVVTVDLTENIAYNVTVKGEGYRTARYTVTMTANKTLNFWNNVLMNADGSAKEECVEVGNDSSKKSVTFLAGDIVKDNNINIYDLSAVVSYFGTDNLVAAHPSYAKYDLNRDGIIDSKDVAYVLVSWGR